MTAMFMPIALAQATVASPVDTTQSFEVDAASAIEWTVVNDGVMGGLSSSEFVDSGSGFAVFRGTLSLENNGGFASVRGLVPVGSLASRPGLVLRVRGDGRAYQMRVHTDRRFDGVAYRAEFSTKAGSWQTIEIPFSEFEATYRGRKPRGAPPLEPAEIRQLGMMVADKIEGPFRLDVEWIRPIG